MTDALHVAIGGELYQIDASVVESIVAWRQPLSIPWPCPLLGLVIERNRVVPVYDPSMLGGRKGDGARLVVCTTSEGPIGIPVSRIFSSASAEDAPGDAARPLDPEALVASLHATDTAPPR